MSWPVDPFRETFDNDSRRLRGRVTLIGLKFTPRRYTGAPETKKAEKYLAL